MSHKVNVINEGQLSNIPPVGILFHNVDRLEMYNWDGEMVNSVKLDDLFAIPAVLQEILKVVSSHQHTPYVLPGPTHDDLEALWKDRIRAAYQLGGADVIHHYRSLSACMYGQDDDNEKPEHPQWLTDILKEEEEEEAQND